MKIAIAGNSFVSLSNTTLLAQCNDVVALDIAPEKIALKQKTPGLKARRSKTSWGNPLENPVA